MTTFNWYQQEALKTASYPELGSNLIYPALGLAGEAGEAADKVKKFWRNEGITGGNQLQEAQKLGLVKELGDVLWYVAALASEIGCSMESIALINIQKLTDRNNRGVVKSEGDNR